MATLTSVLYEILKTNTAWKWTDKQQQKIFEVLKSKLVKAPVLMNCDINLTVKLSYDASSYDVGAVLSHTLADESEGPIVFASRTLNKPLRKNKHKRIIFSSGQGWRDNHLWCKDGQQSIVKEQLYNTVNFF